MTGLSISGALRKFWKRQENLDAFITIDRISLGGQIDRQACEEYQRSLARKSPTLATQIQDIEQYDPQKVWKTLGFYHDFEEVLSAFESPPSNAYVVMTVGNRTVARNRIQMNRILAELLANYGYESSVEFSRHIVQKRKEICDIFFSCRTARMDV